MNIVVDTSVIIAVIANEPQKEKLIAYTKGMDLIAPSSVHWEMCNAFSAMLKQRRITLDQARHALERYHRIPIRFVQIELDETLKLAAKLNIYAYDAYLLRCALKYNLPLLSLDKHLIRVAQRKGTKTIEVI